MWSLGVPKPLRDGTVGCRELRCNGKGSFLLGGKTGTMATQEDVFPKEGPHCWVTTDMSLPFPCWSQPDKMREKFPSPLTFSRKYPLTRFLMRPPQSKKKKKKKTVWQVKDAAATGLSETNAPQDRGLDFGGRSFSGGVGLSLDV